MNAALVSMPVPKPTLAQVIIERIREGASLEETKEYYRFLREIQADEAKVAYAADFVAMQGELPEIPRLGKIDIGRGKPQQFARWEDIAEKIKPVLHKFGFGIQFEIKDNENSVTATAILLHRGGHFTTNPKTLPLDKSGSKNIVQAYGSTQSYAQRYAVNGLLGIASRGEDNDATGTNGPQSSDEFFVTPEQIAKLEKMLERTGRSVETFCQKFRLNNIGQLPASKYMEAAHFLQQHAKPIDLNELGEPDFIHRAKS